jgi:hypothetical protein
MSDTERCSQRLACLQPFMNAPFRQRQVLDSACSIFQSRFSTPSSANRRGARRARWVNGIHRLQPTGLHVPDTSLAQRAMILFARLANALGQPVVPIHAFLQRIAPKTTSTSSARRVTRTQSADHWRRASFRARALWVHTIDDVLTDAQVRARGLVVPYAHGRRHHRRHPFCTLLPHAWPSAATTPRLGEHTNTVRTLLGLLIIWNRTSRRPSDKSRGRRRIARATPRHPYALTSIF